MSTSAVQRMHPPRNMLKFFRSFSCAGEYAVKRTYREARWLEAGLGVVHGRFWLFGIGLADDVGCALSNFPRQTHSAITVVLQSIRIP